MCVGGVRIALYLLDAHLGNGAGHITATLKAPLLLTIRLVRYEAVLRSCGTSPVGRRILTCGSVHSWQLYSAASL